jgi:hypothetical protein
MYAFWRLAPPTGQPKTRSEAAFASAWRSRDNARMARARETCWTVIEAAAGGSSAARDKFARTYLPVVRAYLCARWQGFQLIRAIEDTVQEVFLDCFREGGALAKADRDRGRFGGVDTHGNEGDPDLAR